MFSTTHCSKNYYIYSSKTYRTIDLIQRLTNIFQIYIKVKKSESNIQIIANFKLMCSEWTVEYADNKIETNIERDKKVNLFLQKQGWVVLRFWSQEVRTNLKRCADKIDKVIAKKKIL